MESSAVSMFERCIRSITDRATVFGHDLALGKFVPLRDDPLILHKITIIPWQNSFKVKLSEFECSFESNPRFVFAKTPINWVLDSLRDFKKLHDLQN